MLGTPILYLYASPFLLLSFPKYRARCMALLPTPSMHRLSTMMRATVLRFALRMCEWSLAHNCDAFYCPVCYVQDVGVDIFTLGQYLQPTPKHLPVQDFVTPEKFEYWRRWVDSLPGCPPCISSPPPPPHTPGTLCSA